MEKLQVHTMAELAARFEGEDPDLLLVTEGVARKRGA
jgi:hypothetical protein